MCKSSKSSLMCKASESSLPVYCIYKFTCNCLQLCVSYNGCNYWIIYIGPLIIYGLLMYANIYIYIYYIGPLMYAFRVIYMTLFLFWAKCNQKQASNNLLNRLIYRSPDNLVPQLLFNIYFYFEHNASKSKLTNHYKQSIVLYVVFIFTFHCPPLPFSDNGCNNGNIYI